MIFVDTNIPMYLIGSEHPNKLGAQQLLETAIARGHRLVCDAEVLQEIIHRYVSIRRLDAIQSAFDLLKGVIDETFSIESKDVEQASQVLLAYDGLSSRDALHVAIMKRHGVDRIMSFDSGFDRVPGIERLS